jgi:hypothetical protein
MFSFSTTSFKSLNVKAFWLSLEYNIDEVRDIIIISGLPNAVWDEIYTSIEFSNEMKKFEGLKRCC